MCKKEKYQIPHRLDEVIALIQVLAIDKRTHRSEDGLWVAFQREPLSAKDWTTICTEHPEFFRVSKGEGVEVPVSILANHTFPKEENRIIVDAEYIKMLISVAIDLHDKVQQRTNRRVSFLTALTAALVVAIATITVAVFKPNSQPTIKITNEIHTDSILRLK